MTLSPCTILSFSAMDGTYDLNLLTVTWWAATFQEFWVKRRGRIWGEENGAVGGGAGANPSGGEATVGATVAAVGGNVSEVMTTGGSVAVGDSEVMAGAGRDVVAAGGSGGGEVASGSGGGVGGGSGGATSAPPTPTVEELLAAAERAGDGGRLDRGEEAVSGRVSEKPVLRTTTTLEPRSGDSGIGASRPVPFEDGDFLDSSEP